MIQPLNLSATADARADRTMLAVVVLITLLSWAVEASTLHTELKWQHGGEVGWVEPWVREFFSHLALIMVIPMIPLVLNHSPKPDGLRVQTFVWFLGTSVIFAVAHILLMVGMRTVAYPLILDTSYGFAITSLETWFYEYQKDAFTFLTLVLVFALNRLANQRALETRTAREDARTERKLTLKCGGRTVFLPAAEVVRAQSSANYVEVVTPNKAWLSRMTFKALIDQLDASEAGLIRVHRSHLVNPKHVTEIKSDGAGQSIVLSNGDSVPVSRNYRGDVGELGVAG